MGTLILSRGEIKDEFYDTDFNDVDLSMFDLETESDRIIYSDLGKGKFLKGGDRPFDVKSFIITQLFEYI